ncbi:hypothetical protein [Actinomycetospora aeridis]|uniref:Uncharacterized protein n=1 Tax=Actinomycetospora aeridis TaxID=3129231 RepID=A0ABU8NF39_9PSEU
MAVQCALAGCTEEIEQPEKGPQRKFCCPAHRTAARAARLRSAAAGPVAGDVTPAAATPEEPVDEPAPGVTLSEAEVAQLPATTAPMRASESSDEAPEPAASGSSGSSGERLVTTTRTPGDVPPALKRRPVPLRRVRREPRRARAVIAGTLVVAMAFGGGVSLLDRTDDPASTVGAQRPTAPAPDGQWLLHANVALATLSHQLDVARASEARWLAVLDDVRPPAEVQALVNRRQWLERQMLLLQSQIASYNNLEQARAALALARQNLDELNAATAGPTPTVGANGADLRAQRDMAQRHVEILQMQVDVLAQDVALATTAPVPDTSDITAPLARQVDDLVADPTRQQAPEGDNTSAVALGDPATVSREPSSGDRAVALPDSGEPPRPSSGGGVLESLIDPLVGGTTTGGGGGGDFPEPVTRPVREAPAEVERAVGDTAGGVGAAAGGLVGDVARPVGGLLGGDDRGPDTEAPGDTADLSTLAATPFRTVAGAPGEGGVLDGGGLLGADGPLGRDGRAEGLTDGPRTGTPAADTAPGDVDAPVSDGSGPREVARSLRGPGEDEADASVPTSLDPRSPAAGDEGDATVPDGDGRPTTGEPEAQRDDDEQPSGDEADGIVPVAFTADDSGATGGAADGDALARGIRQSANEQVARTLDEATGTTGAAPGDEQDTGELGRQISDQVDEQVRQSVERAAGGDDQQDDAEQDDGQRDDAPRDDAEQDDAEQDDAEQDDGQDDEQVRSQDREESRSEQPDEEDSDADADSGSDSSSSASSDDGGSDDGGSDDGGSSGGDFGED